MGTIGSTRSHGDSTRRQGHLGRLARLRLRYGNCRAAAGGCHRASLTIKRSDAAAAVRPGPAAPFRLTALAIPQFTRLDRSGGPVLPPLFACEMRARQALVVLAWTGDRSPVWGCTTTIGDQVPPRTRILVRFLPNYALFEHVCQTAALLASLPQRSRRPYWRAISLPAGRVPSSARLASAHRHTSRCSSRVDAAPLLDLPRGTTPERAERLRGRKLGPWR